MERQCVGLRPAASGINLFACVARRKTILCYGRTLLFDDLSLPSGTNVHVSFWKEGGALCCCLLQGCTKWLDLPVWTSNQETRRSTSTTMMERRIAGSAGDVLFVVMGFGKRVALPVAHARGISVRPTLLDSLCAQDVIFDMWCRKVNDAYLNRCGMHACGVLMRVAADIRSLNLEGNVPSNIAFRRKFKILALSSTPHPINFSAL